MRTFFSGLWLILSCSAVMANPCDTYLVSRGSLSATRAEVPATQMFADLDQLAVARKGQDAEVGLLRLERVTVEEAIKGYDAKVGAGDKILGFFGAGSENYKK